MSRLHLEAGAAAVMAQAFSVVMTRAESAADCPFAGTAAIALSVCTEPQGLRGNETASNAGVNCLPLDNRANCYWLVLWLADRITALEFDKQRVEPYSVTCVGKKQICCRSNPTYLPSHAYRFQLQATAAARRQCVAKAHCRWRCRPTIGLRLAISKVSGKSATGVASYSRLLTV